MEELIAFLFAGFALTGSPGPNTLSLAAAGAAFGARSSLGYMAGLLVGMMLAMALTASGIVGLLLAAPAVAPAVTVAAAAYFLYLAFRIATAPPLADADDTARAPSFAAGVLLSLVNPKAYAAMAALYSGFVLIPDVPFLDAVAKWLVLVAVIALVNICWLWGGSLLTRHLRDPRLNRIVNIGFAVLLIVSVVLAVSL